MNAEETRKKMLVFIMGIAPTYEALVKYDEKNAHDYEKMQYPQRILVDKVGYDKILVLGTQKALERHYDAFEKYMREQGYEDVSIEQFTISKLSNQAEFWETFKEFSDKFDCLNIENEWDIDVDLTNGYRSQPMFILEIIRFFCIMNENKCHLGHQHYGSFDNPPRNPSQQQSETTNQVDCLGRTDYYDMTTISELASMARDINDFLKYNQAEGLVNWLRRICEVESCNEQTRQLQRTMRVIQNTALKFSNVVSMNITPMAASVIKELCEAIEQLDNQAVTPQSGPLYPFVMAMRHLRDELRAHLPEGINPLWRWQLALCEWCLERKLYQQAITQAEEVVTTRVAEELAIRCLNKSYDKASIYARDYDKVRKDLGYYICDTCKKKKSEASLYPDLNEAIQEKDDSIVSVRNRINHAYMRNEDIDVTQQEKTLIACARRLIGVMEAYELPEDFLAGAEKELREKAEKKQKNKKK